MDQEERKYRLERQKRVREPVHPFQSETRVSYALLYFKEDMTYMTISSLSQALPHNLRGSDLTKLPLKSSLQLRNSWFGVVVAVSLNERTLSDQQATLERKIRAQEQSRDLSLSRLESVNSDESDNDTEVICESLSEEEFSAVDNGALGSKETTSHKKTIFGASESSSISEPSARTVTAELKLLNISVTKLLTNNSQQLKVMESSLKQLKKIRKALEQNSGRPNAYVAPSDDTIESLEPIMYNGVDIVRLGNRNLSPSEYGILLGRFLWSDEELKDGILCPKKRSQATRSPLDNERSNVFLNAVFTRYGRDEDAVCTARDAINQLGCDIRRGSRHRRPPLISSERTDNTL